MVPIPLDSDGEIAVGILLDQIPVTTKQLAGLSSATGSDVVGGKISKSASPLIRLFPSFLDFSFLAPLGFLLARPNGFQSLLGDGDTGWHLRTGDWMLQNGRVPTYDFFSFSKPGGEWFAWEWIWDAAFAGLQRVGGMAAVLFVSTLVICLSCALLYGITKDKSHNSIVSLFITLVAMCAASFHWLARPHIFTFLFVAIFYHLLDTGAGHRKRMLLGLPLMMVVWTNLHGGFIAGLLIIGAYAAGETLRFLCTAGEERAKSGSRAILYGQVLVACIAATFVNPYFYHLHEHVIGYLSDGYQMAHIGEFQSISFHHPLALFFEVLLILGVATAFWNLLQRKFTAVFLLAGWAHLALISGRNISIYAIVAAPLIAEALTVWIGGLRAGDIPWASRAAARFQRFCSGINATDSIPRLHLVTGAIVWLVGSLLYTPSPSLRFQAEYDPKNFPTRAVDELQKQNLMTTRIFSTDDWSGYVIYRLYPQVRVFLDGRSDFYGPKLGDEFSDIIGVKSGWEDHLRKYGAETVLLPANSILSVAMKGSGRWRCIYEDSVAAIYRPISSGPQVSAAMSGGREPVL
jgi:hypothetical protein